ncbi:hypothetical protein C818_03510 [Lachnospiraceae bacterium MD308]|jgi:Predicted transcriptional regulator|nr:hypothetical protein C818_03510 [Lachnospiraceae bacterium MD308]
MTFGEKLKAARVESGLKQSELAKKLNTTGNTISNWENNVSKPDLDTLSFICGILHVTASYFLEATIPEDEVSIPELKLIKKYRFISTHSPDGASVVDMVLNREYAIAEKLREQKEQLEKVQKMDMEVAEEIVPLRLWAYYGKIACAGTGFIFDDIPSDTVQAPDANADFIIGVNGNSMEPDYSDGEKLYIKKVERINPGEVGIFTINNECFLKEYGENGLVSRNKKYDDIPGNEDVRLIGKVVGKVEE